MGFPDDFVIPVSDTQAYRQFGNSVVVPLVAEVARAMLDWQERAAIMALRGLEPGVFVANPGQLAPASHPNGAQEKVSAGQVVAEPR